MSKLRTRLLMFGPPLIGVSVGVMLSYAIGRTNSDPAWLILPGAFIAVAVMWAREQGEFARDRHYADLLLRVLADGSDVTWTVEHVTRPGDKGAAQ